MTISRRRRIPHGKMLMQGDLAAIKLPDVISFLSMIRATGRLFLQNGEMERSILWKDGEIVFATSNSFEHSLGSFLLRNGKITSEQYEESNRRVTPQMRHGKVLVLMGAISPKDLWWGVKNQILEILYSLFAWEEGQFQLCAPVEEDRQERITLSINTSAVIMEGIRRLDEVASIRERIPSADLVVTRIPGMEAGLEELELSETEMNVFHQIDGTRTIRELAGASELTEFEVTRILFQLLSARVIEYVEEPKAAPVFLDVEDSPELLQTVATYNRMFAFLYSALEDAVGHPQAREVLAGILQSSDTDELWSGVAFQADGRFDDHILIANISELPYSQRRSALDEGLNTMLSIAMFEVSQHLDPKKKAEVFRYISEQRGQLE